MKTKILILSLIFAVGLMGCKEVKKLTQFDLPLSQTFTLPQAPIVLNDFQLPIPPITTDYQQTFEKYNIKNDLVEEVSLKSLKFNLDAPEEADFSFLSSLEVFIAAEGLPEKLIASKTNITDNVGRTLTLDVNSNLDLKEYILKNEITLKVKVTTDKTTSQDYTITTDAIFMVDALILGL